MSTGEILVSMFWDYVNAFVSLALYGSLGWWARKKWTEGGGGKS